MDETKDGEITDKDVTIFPDTPVWAEDAECNKVWASTMDLRIDNKDLGGRRFGIVEV